MTYRTLLKSSSLAVTAACTLFLAAGCGSDEEENNPPVKTTRSATATKPPAPPKPAGPTLVEDLKAEHGIHPNVKMSEANAPDNNEDRIAVLRFFDGMIRGDSNRLSGLLSDSDALILERMVESGEWETATSNIEVIEIETGRGRGVGECALALFEIDGDFDVQLWMYEVDGDPEADDGAVFDALPTPPMMMNRLSGDDQIATWLDIVAQEMARAEEPDEIVEFESLILESEQEEEKASKSSGKRPGGPGRKKPSAPVVNPNPGFGAPGGSPSPGRR